MNTNLNSQRRSDASDSWLGHSGQSAKGLTAPWQRGVSNSVPGQHDHSYARRSPTRCPYFGLALVEGPGGCGRSGWLASMAFRFLRMPAWCGLSRRASWSWWMASVVRPCW